MEKINLAEKYAQFSDHWNPRIIASLNGQEVRIAKIKGDFVWHHHEHEDELFWVQKGVLNIEFRDKTVTLHPGEMIVVPRGIEHRPVAPEEVELLLFEPSSTVNTGDESPNDFTKSDIERI